MQSSRPTLKKTSEKRRAGVPAQPLFIPIPPPSKDKMSFARWAGILIMIALLGWVSGWAVSAWTQPTDTLTAQTNLPTKIQPLPTIRSTHTPADADGDPAPAVPANDSASAFADKAFGTGPFRQGEVVFRANSPEELAALLARAQAAGGSLLGLIRGNNSARLSFPDAASMARFLRSAPGETAVPSPELNYTVTLPTTPTVPTDPYAPGGLSPFGAGALSYMGVPQNNANWGQGVTVAMLDTGLAAGTTGILKGGTISQFDMTSGQTAPGVGHGDMVASLLAGANGEQGVVPASPIVSVRVLDSTGQGDVFGVTDGIYTAIEQGAKVLSLSLGTAQSSDLLQAAINFALSQGIVVVASAGNDGTGQISYPAAYPGVVAVGSIDATGQRATFSNYGPEMDLAAPGVGINTVTTDGNMSFSGTSASAPLVAGAIAGLISTNPNLTAQQAVNLLVQYADFAGPAGANSTVNDFYGNGIVDVGRVINRGNTTYTDMALADMYLNITTLPTSPTAPMQITIQNRGNTFISASSLNINVGGQLIQQTISGVYPGEVRAVTVNLSVQQMLNSGVPVTAEVSLPTFEENISNNSKSRVVKLVPVTK